jgi:hypothetical protein
MLRYHPAARTEELVEYDGVSLAVRLVAHGTPIPRQDVAAVRVSTVAGPIPRCPRRISQAA